MRDKELDYPYLILSIAFLGNNSLYDGNNSSLNWPKCSDEFINLVRERDVIVDCSGTVLVVHTTVEEFQCQ